MRIDDVDPATMTGDQRALYDVYTTGARVAPESPFTLVDAGGRLMGPPAIWIINPVFGKALQQIGSAVRFGSQLPARAREIAILLVGHHHGSAFELYAHERAGAAAGLTEADLAALAERKEPAGLSEVEACVLRTTVRILDAGTLDDDEFRDAAATLGAPGLLELTTIVGYYNMVAWQLAVFDVQPPASA
jgi:4-carboxymuconolactone decarboxylase